MYDMFYLKIIAANRLFYKGKAKAIIVPALDGEKEVLAHHENMVIAINVGEMRFQKEDGAWVTTAVGNGFIQIINNRVTLLADSVESPEEIDVRRATEAKERAEEQLRQKQSLQEYHHSQASLARAMSRLKLRGKYQ